MEHKQRAKMPASQRAKQFMPFAAVKGLEKAIAEQDELLNHTEQIELGEEQIQEINEELKHLDKGQLIDLQFYSDGHYQTLQGVVEQIDFAKGLLRVNGIKVSIKNIIRLTYLPG